MNGKTQSILLQVAFKRAASPEGTADAVRALTAEYYAVLVSLHEQLGINPDEGAGRGRGGDGNYAKAPRMATPASAIAFTIADGSQWLDYRASKVDGSVKPKFPDFKTADGKESVYEFGLDGATNPAFAELAAASDKLTSLTDPF